MVRGEFCREVIRMVIVPVIGQVTRGVGESGATHYGLRIENEGVTGISGLMRSCLFSILWVVVEALIGKERVSIAAELLSLVLLNWAEGCATCVVVRV